MVIFVVKFEGMNIQLEKLGLIEWIARLNDSAMIEKLKNMKDEYAHSKDWWDQLTKEEIESINKGLKDIEDGKIHPHESARKIYEGYL